MPDQEPESLPWLDSMVESIVLRTDFSDRARWDAAREAISTPSDPDGFLADVTFVDDPGYSGMPTERLLELATPEWCERYACLFVADATALSDDEWPVLYLETHDPDRGRSFRVVAAEMWAVENNLSLANMDFEEFAGSVEDDGVYRGF